MIQYILQTYFVQAEKTDNTYFLYTWYKSEQKNKSTHRDASIGLWCLHIPITEMQHLKYSNKLNNSCELKRCENMFAHTIAVMRPHFAKLNNSVFAYTCIVALKPSLPDTFFLVYSKMPYPLSKQQKISQFIYF